MQLAGLLGLTQKDVSQERQHTTIAALGVNLQSALIVHT
jgi:hypothetical protein